MGRNRKSGEKGGWEREKSEVVRVEVGRVGEERVVVHILWACG